MTLKRHRCTDSIGGMLAPSLRRLQSIVRDYAPSCRLRGRFSPVASATAQGKRLRGQCENASALFHLLAGGTAFGWRMMRLGPEWEHGPHYFVRHVSGTVVDPTWDQFPRNTTIPYDMARGQSAGGFRKIPVGTRVAGILVDGQTTTPEALRAALDLPAEEVAAAMLAARQWSVQRLP